MGPTVDTPDSVVLYYNKQAASLIFKKGDNKLFAMMIDLEQKNYTIMKYEPMLRNIGPFPQGYSFNLLTNTSFESFTLGCPQILFEGDKIQPIVPPSKGLVTSAGKFEFEIRLDVKYSNGWLQSSEYIVLHGEIVTKPDLVLDINFVSFPYEVYAGMTMYTRFSSQNLRGNDLAFDLIDPIPGAFYNTDVYMQYTIS